MAVISPDSPLLSFGRDQWLVRDAFEGTLILGATGSGKTTGSGAAIAQAFLRAGWGGLVLCAKPDEAARWQAYARAAGRAPSLITFSARSGHRFNFLRYAMAQAAGQGVVTNVTNLLSTVLQAASGQGASPTHGDSLFWMKASRECITHVLSVLWAAYGDITLDALLKVVHSRPAAPGKIDDPAFRSGFMGQTLERAYDAPAHRMHDADFDNSFNYLTRVLPNPDPRTTGNLVQTLTADLYPLMTGAMRELFGTGLSIVPEMTHHGAVIVLDFPVKEWSEAGVLAQGIFKYLWQKATERRTGGLPVFLWIDEAQFFLSPYDAEFQSTARSARAASVYLSQNLPAFYERIGGRNPHDVTDALLGNFTTKIFHANSCPRTNQWAADIIGKRSEWRESYGENQGESAGSSRGRGSSWNSSSNGQGIQSGGGGSRNFGTNEGWSTGTSRSVQEQVDYPLQPSYFTGLRNGGSANRKRIDAVLFKSASTWQATKARWIPLEFRQ